MRMTPDLSAQSKESSPPLSKTPSPGQSLDMVTERRRREKRGREEEKRGREGERRGREEERITVISITPQQVVNPTVRPRPVVQKRSLKQANR